MVLVEDGGNLLTVLTDGQKSLLVVVGGNVELEHVGSAGGASEDAGVDVETAAVVAVGALEGQVLLAATVVGLGPVGVEADTKGLAVQSLQELILPGNPGPQLIKVGDAVGVVRLHPVHQVRVGVLAIRDLLVDPLTESLVLTVPGGGLSISTLVKGSNVSLATIILALGKVVKVGNGSLAGIILALSKVLQVSNLSFAGVVLTLCPGVKSSNLSLPSAILSVKLAIELCDVHLPGSVVLLLLLLQRLHLVLAEIIFASGGVLESVMVLPQLVMV